MSRRRKPRQQAQGSRYQHQRRTAARSKPTREPGDSPGFGDGDVGLDPAVDLALAQLFRRECSDCGSERLRWFVGADADNVLGSARAEAMLVQMPSEWRAAADCWVCLRCGESGAFGPSEWEPF